MKAHIQRVSRACVRVDGEEVSRIGAGMVCLLGILCGDDAAAAERLAQRLSRLRLFEDEKGRMGRSALEVGAEVLVVSQITLAWDGSRGHRPSFDAALRPAEARALYGTFVGLLAGAGLGVAEGVFGARMELELVNSGPVTFLLEEDGLQDRAPQGM